MTDLFKEKAKNWDSDKRKKILSSAIGSSILKHVPLNNNMSVMDFGAGTGLISSQIAPLVKKILAVDISESMLNQLIAKPELNGKVEIFCQDIIESPIETKLDLIISAMAMHHVKDISKLIQRFAEQLKPGGFIALSDIDKEDGTFHSEEKKGIFHFGFERSELQSILEKNGFVEIIFLTAHNIIKNGNKYPVFLMTARKN